MISLLNMTIYLKCRTKSYEYEKRKLTHSIAADHFLRDFATISRIQNTAAKDNKLSRIIIRKRRVPNRQNVCKIRLHSVIYM